MDQVFVYGTLIKSNRNHYYIEGEKFIGMGNINDYGLYNVSWYPGIIKKAGAKVRGEIYSVRDETLKRLDVLEDEGDEYIRKKIKIEMDSGDILEAFTYVWNGQVDEDTYIPFDKLPWKEK